MPLLKKADNSYVTNVEENLKLLRQTHFKNSDEKFTRTHGSIDKKSGKLNEGLDSFLSLDLLEKAIATLPRGKAPGPDGIKNEVISRLPLTYKKELLEQFRASVKLSFIPPAWLNLKAIYIKKGGNRESNNPKSYRPIGLSSTILKLNERLINWRLKSTVLSTGIPHQHAFTLGLSTETAISELVNFLEKAKYSGQMAMVLSIDIQGAFDTVPFDVIRDSLRAHGVEEELIRWLDYLSTRPDWRTSWDDVLKVPEPTMSPGCVS